MTVYCEDCTHATLRNLHDYQWLCMASPLPPIQSFVKRDVVSEPYLRCKKKNDRGECPDFEQLKKVENGTGSH